MRLILRIAIMVCVGMAVLWSFPAQIKAQEENKAALVIRHSEDDVQTACVTFEEPQIDGLELLSRADLDLVIDVQGGGALVCKLQDTGCPANDCWCQCKGGGDCIYWSYWHHGESGWNYAQAGAILHKVEDGSIDGWSWGPGVVNEAIPPPDLTFDEVCQTGPQEKHRSTEVKALSLDESEGPVSTVPASFSPLAIAIIAGLSLVLVWLRKR